MPAHQERAAGTTPQAGYGSARLAPEPDLEALRVVYVADSARLVAQRLHVVVAVLAVTMGLAALVEWLLTPARTAVTAVAYGLELAVGLAALGALRVPPLGRWPRVIAVVFCVALTSVVAWHVTRSHGPPERLASAYTCMLTGVVLLLPWGWRPQLFVAVAALNALALTSWSGAIAGTDDPIHPFFAFGATAAVSVVAAAYLDRYRRDAFVRTGLLQHQVRQREAAEAALAEEGQITAALARAGRELNASLDASVVFDRLCHLTADVLACQVSATFRWDPAGDVYVPVAITGMGPAEEALGRAVQVNREFISMLFAQAGGADSTEIADVPAARLAQIGLGHAPAPRFLCLALRRDGEIIGMQIVCAVDRPEPFSLAERRIADGLARMASMALMNARLLGDLQRANRLKSEFVSTMSHELRTPLNVILGYAEMACDTSLANHARSECLDRIVSAGRDLLGLIEGTLEIGKIESGNDAVRLETVRLADLWAELGDACDRLPRRAGVALTWHPAPRLEVTTDPRKLTVIIRNLVGNALKFTEYGSVQADLLAGDGRLVLRIADTGIGIRPEDQREIFEMFRQADGSDSRRYGGTGLGLYIVRRFVEQLGGTVAVESTPGAGAVFTATLPTAIAAAAGRPTGVSPAASDAVG